MLRNMKVLINDDGSAEYNGLGEGMRDYIYLGDRLLVEYQPQTGQIYYYTSDQVNSTRVVTDQNGVRVFASVYDPYGGIQKIWENSYSPAMKFSGKERDSESNLDYFGARYYGNYYYRWLSPDPVINRDAALSNPQLWNLYAFCHNNPVTYWDPDGSKDLPFNPAKDRAITRIAGTATPVIIGNSFNKKAYNCHSYASHNSKGDPTDPRNAELVAVGVRKWDQNPDDDIFSQGYRSLDPDAPNKPGDRVLYFVDSNGNGKYDKGEPIIHSAIVQEVDSQGNTTLVIGKMGEQEISINHPNAPGYYDKANDKTTPTLRNYFRKF
ncbi:MAG: RHS repeat-associated core domain-containing protein [Candidatus Saccharicenans sp.]|nr:RHS repeat-associated core domain-containing protein [Candidatus Saccharicenans sp.]